MIIGNPKIRRRMNSVIDNICILGFFILLPFAIIAGICSGLISKVINKWLNRRRSLKKCMAWIMMKRWSCWWLWRITLMRAVQSLTLSPSPKVPSEEPTRGELFGADWSTWRWLAWSVNPQTRTLKVSTQRLQASQQKRIVKMCMRACKWSTTTLYCTSKTRDKLTSKLNIHP